MFHKNFRDFIIERTLSTNKDRLWAKTGLNLGHLLFKMNMKL